MAIIKCKICGGDVSINESLTLGTCKYCGATMTIPREVDELKANLFNRANDLRRNNDFDRASNIFESILAQDRNEAEAYWGLVLCKFGVEYVEDPETHQQVPTCHRTQQYSILADTDYKNAIELADTQAKNYYEEEARVIDAIQKQILALSMKEEAFDVFISYKEKDDTGERTKDSCLAQELYDRLIKEGFKVFFSRITFEEKLGEAWEPTIYAALNSAKVMVVIGSKQEYFLSPWVKNEWGRYIKQIKEGNNKTLIPAYFEMDPYNIPDEFSHLQALDMEKIGFMQDLVHMIKKLIGSKQATENAGNSKLLTKESVNQSSLLDRAYICLEISDFDKADKLLEEVLNINPKNANAYIGKLMVELNINKENELSNTEEPLDTYDNYLLALKFADANLREKLKDFEQIISKRLNERDKLNKQELLKNLELELVEQERKFAEKENEINLTKNEINNITRVSTKFYLFGKLFASNEEKIALERFDTKKLYFGGRIGGIILYIIIMWIALTYLGPKMVSSNDMFISSLFWFLVIVTITVILIRGTSDYLLRSKQLNEVIAPETRRLEKINAEINNLKSKRKMIKSQIATIEQELRTYQT